MGALGDDIRDDPRSRASLFFFVLNLEIIFQRSSRHSGTTFNLSTTFSYSATTKKSIRNHGRINVWTWSDQEKGKILFVVGETLDQRPQTHHDAALCLA
jgi:hypothetical protein